ncbi:MAG: nitric oxide reductase [Crocinitomicaceae bacterium]|nr:nitric oxide reductase [Crocinitomicaceae bacterium]|tara:strand:+ start:2641 stop:3087 length:447 start_codon:yes stop_codon:yes gene_type:complete
MLSKSQAKVFFLGGTVLFASLFLGLSFDTVSNRVGEQTNEDQLTESAIAGRVIWDENNCMGCHTLLGEGAYYAPELTKVIERRGAGYVKTVMMQPNSWAPNGRHMVAYNLSEEEANNMVDFLTWIGNMDLNGFPAKPKYEVKKNETED